MKAPRLVVFSGAVVWLAVGAPAFLYHSAAPFREYVWVVPFLLFGAIFAADCFRPRLAWPAAESVIAIGLLVVRCNGYEAALLGIVAMQLGLRLNRAAGIAWVVVQALVLAVAVAAVMSPRSALLLVPPNLGFQLVAFFAASALTREMAARAALAAANAELRAVQDILGDTSRMAERLRIAHELHDALGHRLTALTLNLEAALQRSPGSARGNVETARTVARDLLEDVRAIVSDYRTRDGVEVALAIRSLIAAVPRPNVHLEVAEGLRVGDPERAHTLLRCAQEIMTNAARHSDAENLWIVVDRTDGTLRIRAHDDGRGGAEPAGGFGLRGMRERIERAGGEIRIDTQPGRGFDITAFFPA